MNNIQPQKIVLISCVSKKQSIPLPAKDLYISDLFIKSLRYAKAMNPDKIFVLSALYGLVPIDKEIAPYNKTLNEMKSAENKAWAESAISELEACCDLHRDEFIFLAGNNYRKNLIPKLANHLIPMKGLAIGKQLQFLGEIS